MKKICESYMIVGAKKEREGGGKSNNDEREQIKQSTGVLKTQRCSSWHKRCITIGSWAFNQIHRRYSSQNHLS